MRQRSPGAPDSRDAGVTNHQPRPGDRVSGRAGLEGRIEHLIDDDRVLIRLTGGPQVAVTRSMLTEQGAGEGHQYLMELGPAEVRQAQKEQSEPSSRNRELVIPVVEETVRVERERVETGRVRLQRLVHEEEQDIEAELVRDQVEVERVPVNQPVADPSHPPQARQDGDTLIIPVCEEVLVVEKRLMLREEVHIRHHIRRDTHRESVPVQREEVRVSRTPGRSDTD